MKQVDTAGGLIFDSKHVLLNTRDSGLYTIPKGHIDEGESFEDAAVREVLEETGVVAEICSWLGSVVREFVELTGENVRKTIQVYEMRAVGGVALSDLNPHKPEGYNEGLGPVIVAHQQAVSNMHHPEEAQLLNNVFASI